MATQSQKDQFVAIISTKLKPSRLDHDRFQVFLDDPEGVDRLADEFIANYERRTYPAIEITGIAEFPDWSKGRVLNGDIRRPKEIDFLAVMSSAYFHPRQTGKKHRYNRPSGHEILASLVASYKAGEDKNGNTYDVSETDLIHGHFGCVELIYMEKNWNTLPEPFKAWAKNKLLYGWRDVVRRDNGNLAVPYFDCDIDKPCVAWVNVGNSCSWNGNEPSLREQVSTQG